MGSARLNGLRAGSAVCSRATCAALLAAAGTAASLLFVQPAHATDFSWASAASGNWNVATNWSPNGTPNAAADRATIDATGAPYTVTLNINATLEDFTLDSSDATLFTSGTTFTIGDLARILDGLYHAQSSTVTGAGTFRINGGGSALFFGTNSINTASFIQNGAVEVRGVSGLNSTLVVGNSFTNAGTFTFNSTVNATANMTVNGGGVFTNDGTVNIERGSGGARSFNAIIINNGTFNIDSNAEFSRNNGVYTNNGTITIEGPDDSLFINSASQNFVQAGGTLNIPVSGGVHVQSASFTMNGGTMNGQALITSGTLNYNAPSGGNFRLRGSPSMTGNVPTGGNVLVQGESGINSGLTAAPFTNSGTMEFSSTVVAAANMTVSGDGAFTNAGTVNIERGAGGQRLYSFNLNNTGDFNVDTNAEFSRTSGVYTNNGTFTIEGADDSLFINGASQNFVQAGGTLNIPVSGGVHVQSASFTMSGGTMNGQALITSGTLNYNAITGGDFRIRGNSAMTGNIPVGGSVLVQGEPAINSGLTAAPFTSSGTMQFNSTVVAAANMTVSGDGAFTNAGTVNIERGAGGQRLFSFNLTNTGDFNVDTNAEFSRTSGVYTNNGTFTIEGGDDSLFINGASQNFVQSGGTLTIPVSGGLHVQSASFTMNGGTMNGQALITSGTLNYNAITGGDFRIRGNSAMTGNIPTGGNVLVQGEPAINTSLTAAPFTNNGTLTFNTLVNAAANLTVSGDGAFTNAGTVNIERGADGQRLYSFNLTNTGDFGINTNAEFSRSSGVYTNTGDFTINGLDDSLFINAASQVFNQNAGTLNLPYSGALNVQSATFNFNGGTLNGIPLVTAGTLGINTTNPGTMRVRGFSSLVGGVAAGQTVLVQGEPALNTGLTSANPFTNAGTMTFTSLVNASSNLTVGGAGVFTNTGTMNIEFGAGGQRDFAMVMNNQGQVNVNTPATIGKSGAAHTSSGNFKISAGASATFNIGASLTNQPGGVVSGTGTLGVTGLLTPALINNGTVSPGGSTGTLAITGGFTQNTSGLLDIEIGGTGAGQFDRLTVSTTATLGGALGVTLTDGFAPAWNQSFSIMTATAFVGDFANFNYPSLTNPDWVWWNQKIGTSYTIGVRHLADLNHNGLVGFDDLNLVIANWETANAAGDVNASGFVDFADLNLVVNFFGLTAPAVVPAPGTLALLALGAGCAARRSRRSHSN